MEPSYKVDHSEMWRVPERFRAAGASERVPVQGKPCLFSGENVDGLFLARVYFVNVATSLAEHSKQCATREYCHLANDRTSLLRHYSSGLRGLGLEIQ
jgi:hypothetical protein